MTDSDDVIVIMRKVTEQYGGERFALAVATELAYEANAASAGAARAIADANTDPDELRRIEAACFYRNLITTTPEAVHAAIKAVLASGEFNNPKKD